VGSTLAGGARILMENNLPDVFSELVRLAVADAEKVHLSPDHVLHLAYWNSRHDGSNICHNCLAGSVIVFSMQENTDNEIVSPEQFTEEIADKLYALDRLRHGKIELALEEFYGTKSRDIRDIQNYFNMDFTEEYKCCLRFQGVVGIDFEFEDLKTKLLWTADWLESYGH
jgi:hypothetical protein